MAIQEQVHTWPIVGGVDEKAHPRLSVRPLVTENCRQFESGSIGKRYGTVCIGTSNTMLGGATPPAPELLTSRGDELVRIGGDTLSVYEAIGSTDQVRRSFKPECLITRETVTLGEPFVRDPDVAYGEGYAVYAHLASVSGAALLEIRVTVVKLATGARIHSNYVVESISSGSFSAPKVLVIGTTAIVVYRKDAVLRARALDLTAQTWGSLTSLPNATGLATGSIQGGLIDACGMSDRFAVAFEKTAGSPYVYVGTWSASLASITAPVGFGTDQGVSSFALRGTTGEELWFGYANYTGGTTYNVIVRSLNPATLAVTSGPTTLESVVSVSGVINLGVERLTSSTAVFVWTVLTTSVRWREFSTAGGGTAGAAGVEFLLKAWAVSRPFKDPTTGHTYLLVVNDHATHGTLFLLNIGLLNDDPTNVVQTARIVAVSAPRQVPAINSTTSSFYRSFSSLSSAPIVSSGRRLVAAYVSSSVSLASVSAGALLDVRIGAIKPSAAYAGSSLVLSGGVPSLYDGDMVTELGFAHEPDVGLIAAIAAGSGGSLTPNRTYFYSFVYEWYLSNGDVVRSPPSDPLNPKMRVDLSLTQNKASYELPYLHLTNKENVVTDVRKVQIVVYRTEGNGSTFYRLTSFNVPTTNLNDQYQLVKTVMDDTLADADLALRPVLYTTAALADEVPPSSAHVAYIGNRVWFSGTDDDAIWFSHELVQGDAPHFSSQNTIAPFEGGRVVAMAEMDEKKIILKENALYYVVGDGPGLTGTTGTFSLPVRVQTDVGCIDSRSIASTKNGVFFLSQNGLALLDRSLNVSLVGTAVVDSVGSAGIVATTNVADQNVVRFCVEGTMRTVELDLFHGGAWGTNIYSDPASLGSPTIAAACFARGTWWHVTSEGKLFQETRSAHTDVSGGTTSYTRMRVRLNYLSFAGLQGYQRVWWVSAFGDRKTPHDMTMNLYVDDEASTSQTWTWTAAQIAAWGRYQAQLHVLHQECEALSVEVTDTAPSSGSIGTGQGFVLAGISAEVGIERGIRRAPHVQSG